METVNVSESGGFLHHLTHSRGGGRFYFFPQALKWPCWVKPIQLAMERTLKELNYLGIKPALELNSFKSAMRHSSIFTALIIIRY